MIRQLENLLARSAAGCPVNHVISKLVPGHLLYPVPSHRMVCRDGLRLDLDLSDYIDHALFFGIKGTEGKSYQNLMEMLEPHYNCVDVGTKNGYLSLRMASLAHKGRTLGFEADPTNFQQSVNNVDLNSLGNVSIHNIGLGDRQGKGVMELRVAANRGGNRISGGDSGGAKITIERLDDIYATYGLEPVHLIKIDVEGYELKVLRGAVAILRKWKPILFIEVDDANLRDQGDSACALLLFLQELGYENLKYAGTADAVTEKSGYENRHFDLIAR